MAAALPCCWHCSLVLRPQSEPLRLPQCYVQGAATGSTPSLRPMFSAPLRLAACSLRNFPVTTVRTLALTLTLVFES